MTTETESSGDGDSASKHLQSLENSSALNLRSPEANVELLNTDRNTLTTDENMRETDNMLTERDNEGRDTKNNSLISENEKTRIVGNEIKICQEGFSPNVQVYNDSSSDDGELPNIHNNIRVSRIRMESNATQ